MEEPKIISSTKDDYTLEFNPKAHRYYLITKGESRRRPLVSATTTNNGFPVSESLIKWRIKNGIEEYISGQKLEKAGDIGTFSHQFFYDVEQGKKINVPEIPEVQNIVGLHKKWFDRIGKNDEVLFREQIMCYPMFMIAGTLDRLARRGNKIILQDYKTAKGIYDSAFFQMAWYDMMAHFWLGIEVQAWEVLRFGKEDDEPETKLKDDPEEMKDFKEQALRNLQTYRFASKYRP